MSYNNINSTKSISSSDSLDNVNNTQPQPQGTWVWDKKEIDDVNGTVVGSATVGSPKLQDFRAILRNKLGDGTQNQKLATESGATPISPNYSVNRSWLYPFSLSLFWCCPQRVVWQILLSL